VRKLRWGRGGQGKSGGVRAIYYFHDEGMPLYLLTMFAKGDRANLSKAERNDLAELTALLVKTWKGRSSWVPHTRASRAAYWKPSNTPKAARKASVFIALVPWT
jgi:hypothetical protein